MSKRLPILKLFLLPVFAGTAYGAYCYYMEQYLENQHKVIAPIRYLQQLHRCLNQSDKVEEVTKIYEHMATHMDKFVIDPSRIKERTADSKVERDVEQGATGIKSLFKVEKDIEVNYFNQRVEKRNGKFTLGVWTNLNDVTLSSHRNTQPMLALVEKSLKIRNKKCRSLADSAASNLDRGYLQEYIECMTASAGHVARLERQVDIGRKFIRNQLTK